MDTGFGPPREPVEIRFDFAHLRRKGDLTGGGRLSGGLHLMHDFYAEVDDQDLPYLLTFTIAAWRGKLVASQVWVRSRPGGEPVTATGIRKVKVDSYVASIKAKLPSELGGMNSLFLRQVGRGTIPEMPEVGVYHLTSATEVAALFRDEGKRLPPDMTLPEVARRYREALNDPDPRVSRAPIQYVADTLNYSRGHASRLVSQARAQGMLGTARQIRRGQAAAGSEGDAK